MEGGGRHDLNHHQASPMSCQACLNRREFLTRSALAAAALAAVEACGDGQIGPPVRTNIGGGDPNVPPGPPLTVSLASHPELATVGVLVQLDRERAVMRTSATTFLGLSRICTHEQCDTEVRNNRLECPCHGSLFASDGTVIHGPNVASDPITPLRQLAVTIDAAAGTITIA
jgi:Rieske Fe-S protein